MPFLVYQGPKSRRSVLTASGQWVPAQRAAVGKRFDRAEAERQVEALRTAIPGVLFGVAEVSGPLGAVGP